MQVGLLMPALRPLSMGPTDASRDNRIQRRQHRADRPVHLRRRLNGILGHAAARRCLVHRDRLEPADGCGGHKPDALFAAQERGW
ncbi:hypothetical protein G6F62_015046 [Rhizopus arrhizus]|nr:hypothetical protein G6F66_014524 [Rhizopus arrhizus]KAG1308371.1 hypothetical protein G6F62_015046 [Rhizopus arrhizus]KAG1315093.1 hypothetical protein G6F63_016137 [Rhizopus arrhizus]